MYFILLTIDRNGRQLLVDDAHLLVDDAHLLVIAFVCEQAQSSKDLVSCCSKTCCLLYCLAQERLMNVQN